MTAEHGDVLLGRLAVHYRKISSAQLEEAVQEQGRHPHRQLGAILVERGFVTSAELDELLDVQRRYVAEAERRRAQRLATPPRKPEPVETLDLDDDDDGDEAPLELADTTSAPAPAAAPAAAPARPSSFSPNTQAVQWLQGVLHKAVESHASDVHVHSGSPVKLRRFTRLLDLTRQPVPVDHATTMLRSVLDDGQRARLDQLGQVDFSYAIDGVGRFRCNIYRQHRGLDGVFHVIPSAPPSLDQLGVPSHVAKLTNYHQGLVLITGPAGCGKSSTMAALVNLINQDRSEHILTIEDPIEYVHPSRRSLVNQREVVRHTESFARALRAALREDPDVICIGELRDLETISLALSAAETGHLVLATLHTNSAIRTINRLVGAYPPSQQSQVRTMLSESLRAVISQRLMPNAAGNGVALGIEILMVNRAVGNLIRENRAFQIQSVLQTGRAQGMCLLDHSLAELVRAGVITPQTAASNSETPQQFVRQA